MDEPLFISNSELSTETESASRRAVVWTMIALIACLLLGEVALRITGWPRAVPYELGGEEYNAVAGVMNRGDVPEIMVVGSSRARESVVLPLLKSRLSERMGRDVVVGNFATSGGRASDVEAIVSRALRAMHPPKIILYGVAERDMNATGAVFDQTPRFWNYADWKKTMDAAGTKRLLPELATVTRNEIGRHIRLLGTREQIRLTLRQKLDGTFRDARDTLIYGQLTDWQRNSPHRSLVDRPAPADRVSQNARDFDRRDWPFPDPTMTACLRRMIAQVEASGAQLILYEVPPSRAVRRALPATVYPAFIKAIEEEASGKRQVRFETLNRLNVTLSDRDFREMTHVNLNGSTKLTNALADVIATPHTMQNATPTTVPAK